jgi:arylsulfatase A-like enzyme
MMTGSYSYRNYRPYGICPAWRKTGVDPGFTTSARIAKRAGYATAFFGKSGMGSRFQRVSTEEGFIEKERFKNYDLTRRTSGPNQLGFDYSFELPGGVQAAPGSTIKMIKPDQSGYATAPKHHDRTLMEDSNWDPTRVGPMLAEKALACIERQTSVSPSQPFFLYYCAQAVHTPHMTPKELGGVKIGVVWYELISAMDIVATIGSVSGQKITEEQAMDSVNLMPLLKQTHGAEGHRFLMHYSEADKAALRLGEWKLHFSVEQLKDLKPTHLFNLNANPG